MGLYLCAYLIRGTCVKWCASDGRTGSIPTRARTQRGAERLWERHWPEIARAAIEADRFDGFELLSPLKIGPALGPAPVALPRAAGDSARAAASARYNAAVDAWESAGGDAPSRRGFPSRSLPGSINSELTISYWIGVALGSYLRD